MIGLNSPLAHMTVLDMKRASEKITRNQWIWLGAGVFAVFALGFEIVQSLQKPTKNSAEDSTRESANESTNESIDTYIPYGYRLVPLQLQNQESLQSFMGAYAIVDLFQPGSEGRGKGQLVGRGFKLVRAPRNPNEFAVLVKAHDVVQLSGSGGPYFAVLHNPDADRTAADSLHRPSSSRIDYEKE